MNHNLHTPPDAPAGVATAPVVHLGAPAVTLTLTPVNAGAATAPAHAPSLAGAQASTGSPASGAPAPGGLGDHPAPGAVPSSAGAPLMAGAGLAHGAQPADELARLRAENAALLAARAADLDTQAAAAIEAAASRGAIPPQDTAAKARWKSILKADFANGAAALAALAPAAVLTAGRLTGLPPLSGGRSAGGVESGHDLKRAILAYAQDPHPLQRGLLFHREISRAFKSDEGLSAILHAARAVRAELPVEAANSLGTLTGTLVTQRSLQLLKLSFPVLDRITTDFSAENAMYGQTVMTRTRSVPTVTAYDPVAGYTTDNAATADVPVTINNHNAVQVSFNANELASTRRLLFGEQEEGMHYAIGKSLVDALYALILPANYANATVAALGAFGRPVLINMGRNLIKRGVPSMNRTALLYSDYFAQLATDPAIVTMAAFSKPEIIEGYQLPDVAGFKVIDAPNLPGTGNLAGAAFTPDALVLAARVPNNYAEVFPGATGGGVTSIVTNPDTGVSVMLVEYVNHALGQAVMRLAFMFGVAVGQTASLERLTSQ